MPRVRLYPAVALKLLGENGGTVACSQLTAQTELALGTHGSLRQHTVHRHFVGPLIERGLVQDVRFEGSSTTYVLTDAGRIVYFTTYAPRASAEEKWMPYDWFTRSLA